MSRLAPISSEHPPAEKARAGGSRAVAWIITALLIVIVPAMIGAIGWRWATVRGPTTAVVVRGDASLEGAQIVVTGKDKTFQAKLGHDNGWQTPILLDPGFYHITATHRGQRILIADFAVDNLHGVSYDLPPLVWIVGNREVAAATIARVSTGTEPFTSLDVRLNAEDHFRTAIHLPTGSYRVSARRSMISDRIIAEIPVTVERTGTAPLNVDLAKAVLEGNE